MLLVMPAGDPLSFSTKSSSPSNLPQSRINPPIPPISLIHHSRILRSDRLRHSHRSRTSRFDTLPHSNPSASQQRRPKCPTLLSLQKLHRLPIHIGLNLTPQRPPRSAATQPDSLHRHAKLPEQSERISQAERHSFKYR